MSNDMTFEWDEQKRLATIEKHGLDFRAAIQVFWTDPLVMKSKHLGEDRYLAVGILAGVEVAVVYTMRGHTVRIISARRARLNERKAYHARNA